MPSVIDNHRHLILHSSIIFCILTTLIPNAEAHAAHTGKHENHQKVSLQLKWKHQFQFAGFYAAKEKGFYSDEKLDVTFIEGTPGIDFVETVVSGKAQYGIEMPDLLLKRAEGVPVVVIGCIFQHSPVALFSLSESNIRSPNELIGKTIMLRPESDADLRAMFTHEGITLNSIDVIDHSFNIRDLLEGRVTAMSLYSTAYAADLKNRNIQFSVLQPRFYGVDFYGDCLFTSEKEIHDHPDQVAAFHRASMKGWEYAMDHSEELANYIHENLRPDRTVAVLMDEAREMIPLLLPNVIEIGHSNPERWKHIRQVFIQQGMLDSSADFEGFLYKPPQKPRFLFLYIGLGLLLGVVIVGTLSRYWNIRLKAMVNERTRELRENTDKHERLINNLQQTFLYRYNSEGAFDYFSPSVSHVLGYQASELPSIFIGFFTDDIVNRVALRHMQRSLRGERQPPYELKVCHSDNGIRWLELSETPVYGTGDTIIAVEGVAHDITDRKDFSKELEKWWHIFKAAKWGIAVGDAQGKNIILSNPAFAQMHGYSEEEIQGKTIAGMFPASFRPKIKALISECHELGHKIVEVPHLRKDGSIFPVLQDVTSVKDENGDVMYRIVSFQDISDLKQAEKEKHLLEARLNQTSKMEAIGTLAGGIAHDFNNILGGIIGYADMSLDLTETGSILEANLQKIVKAADRAGRLVKQILSFSRKSNENRVPNFLNEVVEEAVHLIRATLPASVEIKTLIMKDTLPVLADSTKIHETVINLCTNAAQAMNDKGTIEVISREEEVLSPCEGRLGEIEPGMYSVLTVRDNGSGMDEVTVERIFEPFFTTKETGKGTGMGLAVVFGIIQSHNGNITVESTPGIGTEFRIFFPKTNALPQKQATDPETLPKGNEKVLYVDDEPDLTEVVTVMLKNLGYQVTVFGESRKALNEFRNSPYHYDLVITDQTMPDMTGFELAVEMLAINKNIPVILCTGYSKLIDEKTALEAGIKAFIMKPIRKHELARTVRRILDTVKAKTVMI